MIEIVLAMIVRKYQNDFFYNVIDLWVPALLAQYANKRTLNKQWFHKHDIIRLDCTTRYAENPNVKLKKY